MTFLRRLVNLLPMPSLRTQRLIAAVVVLSQALIAVTGSVVRVTASGLGCPTWPQCFPGSFTPVPHAEVPGIHQAVEFGNRLITFVVVHTALHCWPSWPSPGPGAGARYWCTPG